MSLIVYNVISASLDISFDYLDGDEIFGYTAKADYSIDLSDVSFTDNAGTLITGRDAIKRAYLQKNITARIGADEYVNGVIQGVDFEQSALVGAEIAKISIQEYKRLSDYSNHTFAKYLPSPHLLESFEESYDFNRSEESYSYTRSIEIKYKQSTEATDEFLNNVKVFVSNYYHEVRPNLGYLSDGISENARFDKKFNGILSETIDLIGLSYGLTENFDSSFIDESSSVSKQTKITDNLDESGYQNKSYNITLSSLKYDNTGVLRRAVQDTIAEIIAAESAYGTPSSIEKGFSKNGRSAYLTISFSKNPKSFRDNTLTYSCGQQKAAAFFEYSLKSEYASIGVNNRERLKASRAFWSEQSLYDVTRVLALYPSAGSIYEKNRQVTFDYSSGKIIDDIVFTNDPAYAQGLPEGILKFKITMNKDNGVNRFARIMDIESLKEKLTISSLKTLAQASVTAETISSPDYGLFHGKNFLNSKTSELNAVLGEDTYYITSDQTTIDLANGTTSRVINYVIPQT